MACGLRRSLCWPLHVVSLPGLVWASPQRGGWFQDWTAKREQEAGGSHDASDHLTLEVMQGHSCHLLLLEAVMKFRLGLRGMEIEPAS